MYLLLVLAVGLCLAGCTETSTAVSSGYGLEAGSGSESDVLDTISLSPLKNCSSELWRSWRNEKCVCGDSLGGIVRCNTTREKIGVLQCYCLFNETESSSSLAIGACLYGCFKVHKYQYSHLYRVYQTVNDLNSPCEEFNRSGPLCGGCNDSALGVPAYSFSLKCRPCTFSWKNIAKYVAIAYGPLTIFFVIIVVFTVSVNSAPLHGYIFVAQILASSIVMRILQTMREMQGFEHMFQKFSTIFAATVYGFWNLDFFRFANHYYCLHPALSTLSIMSLDYLIAVYPIIVIVLLYIVANLHGRGYRVLMFMWKPLICCFGRFRQKLDIRTSLIDAFGTFFTLSYVKFLSTTIDLMATTSIRDENGRHLHYRMYYDGRYLFMKGDHLRYAVVGLTCLILFNIFPIIFLLLYPRRFFQRRIPLYVRRTLHPFMDTLLGIYRDGTDGGYDCRFFVVVYLIARIAIYSMLLVAFNSFAFLLVAIVTTFTAMLVAVFKPYKSAVYNTVDTILVTLLALTYTGLASFFFASSVSSQQLPFARILTIIPVPFPFLYVCGLVLYKVCVQFKLRRKTVRFFQFVFLCLGRAYLHLTRKWNRRQEMEDFSTPNERTLLVNRFTET